ncbi:Uncharacterised protein [Neisseria meningitidis]|nr:Uncharacterised protein [Neisseria meningitidis]
MARMEMPAQSVLPVETTLSGKALFTVKSSNGVAAADRQLVLGNQRRFVPLCMDSGFVGKLLFAQHKRGRCIQSGGYDFHTGCAWNSTAAVFFRCGHTLAHTGTPFVR